MAHQNAEGTLHQRNNLTEGKWKGRHHRKVLLKYRKNHQPEPGAGLIPD